MSISTWFKRLGIVERPWVINARCGAHQGLPWISDIKPNPLEIARMAEVCADCPVQKSCAGYGLTTTGGFYAGVWLPWPSSSSSSSNNTRYLRRRSRNELRRLSA